MKISSWIDHRFGISQRSSSLGQEIRGGVVAFFAVGYIVILNPLILGAPQGSLRNVDVLGHTLLISQVAAVTALTAGVLSILMGWIANMPYVMAAGLGINNLLATAVITKVSWQQAMGFVVLSGLIIVVLAISGLRTAVFEAIPRELKIAITVGIGCFVAFIGMVDSGFVHRNVDAAHTSIPTSLGEDNSIISWPMLVFVLGVFIIGFFIVKQVQGSFLLGITLTTIIAVIVQHYTHHGALPDDSHGWALNIPQLPHTWGAIPDLSLIGQVNLTGGYRAIGWINTLVIIFTLVLSDFFDAMGTMSGLAHEAGIADAEGNIAQITPALIVEGTGAVVGGLCSASSNTVFVESATGIAEGARTGLAAIVSGVLFIVAMFFTPLYAIVPQEAASPALIIVGAMMLGQIRTVDLTQLEISIPIFITIIVMPCTYSIANGIGAGCITWVVLACAKGKIRTIHPILWIIVGCFACYFAKNTLATL